MDADLARLLTDLVDSAALPVPMKARAGLHAGQVLIREAPAEDVALDAKPFEVDGVSKLLAARVMSTALDGQTREIRHSLPAERDAFVGGVLAMTWHAASEISGRRACLAG